MNIRPILRTIVWKPEYDVEVEFINKHHKKFVEALNLLAHVIKERQCRELMMDVFFKLTFYIENYFIEEETYLRNYNYPKFQQHKTEHSKFIEEFVHFRNEYGKDDRVCLKMYQFLRKWFDSHILQYDNDAVNFLIQNDVK